jgi:hypothetical protein
MTFGRISGLAAAMLLFAGLPVAIDFPAASARADGPLAVMRVTDACAQSSECLKIPRYICSTHHYDHDGYICTRGCGDQED